MKGLSEIVHPTLRVLEHGMDTLIGELDRVRHRMVTVAGMITSGGEAQAVSVPSITLLTCQLNHLRKPTADRGTVAGSRRTTTMRWNQRGWTMNRRLVRSQRPLMNL
jgi:hypothetical protein